MKILLGELSVDKISPVPHKKLNWTLAFLGLETKQLPYGRWLFRIEKHWEWWRIDLFWFTVVNTYQDFVNK